MLICRVTEEGAGRGEPAENASHCQTANELFELMAKDHDFEAGDDPLTTSDLVLLYKNIDLGNQLMSNVRKIPNQHVENVFHDDPETDSELSESCSSEELLNIVFTNKERIDLFTNSSPLNSLCHKLGDLEMQVSKMSHDLYGDRNLLLNKDSYLKEQLQSLQLITRAGEFNNVLPTSLLDLICSKRLGDNYNFYLDNVITHVNHTIDQLKRISNGDYLPPKVKEKWRELDSKSIENTSKVLTTSMSMPLQVKRMDRMASMMPVWDDIVHAEIDLRSLVKIMEKKIVLEVPRMISGSCNIFSRCRADKFVISCSRRRSSEERSQEPRVDAVLTVRTTPAGQLIGDVHSIMVLQPEHQTIEKDCTKIMPLEYKNPEQADTLIPKVIELPETEQNIRDKNIEDKNIVSPKSDEFGSVCSLSDAADSKDGDSETKDDTDTSSCVSRPGSPHRMEQILSTATRVVRSEAASNHATPNDLHFSISTLNRPNSLPEESTSNSYYKDKTQKKSPERVRLKSPYENKSYILEERKRKKLLELKERRERRQIASNENSKVTKSRTFPQKVNSVTKLSITNKSFYNSIYGRNANGENTRKMSVATINNTKPRKGTQKIDEELDESEADAEGDKVLSDSSQKIICKGNFLEDTETEMSYLKSKQDSDFLQTPTTASVISNDSAANLCPQSMACTSHKSLNVSQQESTTQLEKQSLEHHLEILDTQDVLKKDSTAYTSTVDNDKAPAVECRRSLEKICTLMKKLQQIEISETVKKKALASELRAFTSESGSSLKRRVSFSSPRIEKNIKDESQKEMDEDLHTAAVPKVVISAKLQPKADEKSRSKAKPRVKTIPENPLKAISQLLHKFDSVQKSRPKIADPKSVNRSMLTENAELEVKIQKRRSRIESPVREHPKAKVKARFVREEPEVKPQVPEENINDFIDEVKEARGEAVRGPPQFSSRLNALAQPKRTYVQALAAEFPKRQTPARAQRPSMHHSRAWLRADGRVSPVSVRAPQSSLERTAKPRRSSAGTLKHRVRDSPQLDTLVAATADALHAVEKKVALESPSCHCSAECAPLLPCNIQSSSEISFETEDGQSGSIGLKLQRMVSAILRAERPPRATDDAKPHPSPPPVATACVVQEPIQTQTVIEEIFEERTAIEEIITEETSEPTDGQFEGANHDVTRVNSVTELQKLEHALHRSLSSGACACAGRLRVNKLTLSPRPSLQRVVMHQSGDTTLLLKSNLMQKIQLTCQSSDQKIDLMGVLSRTRFDNGFSKFPLQISTVGYAFPVSECQIKKITPRIFNRDKCQIKKITPRIFNRDMLVTCDAETSCTISVKHSSGSAVINDAKGKTAYHGFSDDKCVRVSDKNDETDIGSDSTITESSDSKEVTASVQKENCPPSDYNTSFDILVELLNEIQKITTCGSDEASFQTQKSVSSEFSRGEESVNVPSNSWVTVSNSYMSSEAQLGAAVPEMNSVSAEAVELRPLCEDKEMLATVTPEYAVASTSLQALLPISIAASTCTNLATSSCSVSAFTHTEQCDIGCNTLTSARDKITKHIGIETNRTCVKSLVPYYNNMFKVGMTKTAILSTENSVVTVTKGNVAAVRNILVDIAPVQKNKRILNLREEIENDKEVYKYCPNVGEVDSKLKVKRDVLMTFYSILVLTVFAALALPEMMQYA